MVEENDEGPEGDVEMIDDEEQEEEGLEKYTWHSLGMQVGMIVVFGAALSEYWVGEIVELMKVEWNDDGTLLGDVKVHEYGNTATAFKGSQDPLYTLPAKVFRGPSNRVEVHTTYTPFMWLCGQSQS